MEQSEFADAAMEALESCPSRPEADSLLRKLLAEEGERVAGAVAIAEVLVPMLAERLSEEQGVAVRHAPDARAARRAAAGPPGETPGIADFIDEMLAQDRPRNR